MTKEDKELLLKDLCARLPYGVIVESLWIEKLTDVDGYEGKLTTTTIELFIDNEVIVKPYLRTMSSMTKEELREYNHLYAERENNNEFDDIKQYSDLINWLLEHYFDYLGLIKKGLAIEVTESNDPYKE